MVSSKKQKRFSWGADSEATPDYIREYVSIGAQEDDNEVAQAAREYAANSCIEDLEAQRYWLINKLSTGKPYKMSDLYDQAIYSRKGFEAGALWGLQQAMEMMKARFRI